MSIKVAIGLLSVIVGCATAVSSSGGTVSPASLGTVTMGGGSKCVEFVADTVPTGGSTDLKGELKNDSNFIVNDVTVKILPKTPANGNVPFLNSITVNGATGSGGSGTTRINVALGSGQTIQKDGKVDVTVDLVPNSATPAATEWKICFTPSIPDGSNMSTHYDYIGAFNIPSGGTASGTLAYPCNSGIGLWLKNTDSPESNMSITQLEVEVTFPASGVSVSNGWMRNEGGEPISASASVTSTKVTFTNFTAIPRNGEVAVYLSFSEAPTGDGLDYKITPTFE